MFFIFSEGTCMAMGVQVSPDTFMSVFDFLWRQTAGRKCLKPRQTLSDNPVIEQQPFCVDNYIWQQLERLTGSHLTHFPSYQAGYLTWSLLKRYDSPGLLLGVSEWSQILQLTFTLFPWMLMTPEAPWAAGTRHNDVCGDGNHLAALWKFTKRGNESVGKK